MNNYEATFGSTGGNGFNRMTFEDASSVARINRGLSVNGSQMTYGEAFKCRWSKIRSGLSTC
jgi:hypothetical protein